MGRHSNELDTSTYPGRFAERLRKLREKTGLTVDELAQKSGIQAQTIYRWESGKNAGISRLPDLAKALGVKISKLLPEE